MWWGHHDFGWAGLLFGGLMMLLFWGGLLVLGWALLRQALGSTRQQTNGQARPSSSALEILKERYARGEIGKAEYEEIRRDLES